MKKTLAFIFLCTMLISCTKNGDFSQTTSEILKFTNNHKDGYSVGDGYVLKTANEIMFLQSTTQDKTTFDKAVVVTFKNGQLPEIQTGDVGYAEISFLPGKRGLMIHLKDDNRVLFWGLNETDNKNSYESLRSTLQDADILPAALGFGVSVLKGKWNRNSFLVDTAPSVFDRLLSASDLTHYKDLSDGGGGAMKCTSGGAGSTSCSVGTAVATVETSCSVSCSAGYYACCDSETTLCKCLPNPP